MFGLRELRHCPPHFERVQFNLYTTEKTITDWIYENLSGRFYAGRVDTLNESTNTTSRQHLIAFEYPSEASYFSLFLPEINQPTDFL